jgi:hypothetical protein
VRNINEVRDLVRDSRFCVEIEIVLRDSANHLEMSSNGNDRWRYLNDLVQQAASDTSGRSPTELKQYLNL